MTAYIKVNGEWVVSSRPHIKRNTVWAPAKEVYVKRSGVYTSSFKYDVVPPQRPQVDLYVAGNRYISVGIRLPGGTANDPTLKMIRVLASATAQPTSPFGSGYISTADVTYPKESWSDWYYNGGSPVSNHGDTNTIDLKQYPPNPTSTTNLPGGKFYYFSAWSLDFEGNWSAGTYTKIWMPKDGVASERIIVKESVFSPVSAGSLDSTNAFTNGVVMARNSPVSNGVWYLNDRLTDSVGERGTPTIRSASIRVSRTNDNGASAANVRLFWHGKSDGQAVAVADMKTPTVIGTINKGEAKWLPIPTSWYSLLNTQIKGFGLRTGAAASDYIVANDLTTDYHCGEVWLVWEEAV